MDTIASKLKAIGTKKSIGGTSGIQQANNIKQKLVSMSANKLKADMNAIKQKPEDKKKFIGYGEKSLLLHNLGKNDVADKINESDTFGLTPEELIKFQTKKMEEKERTSGLNPFVRRVDNSVHFAKGTSEEEKQSYLKAFEGKQNQLDSNDKTSFSQYQQLGGGAAGNDQGRVIQKKYTIDIFKKRNFDSKK
jgi:hypothetical protein